MAAYSSESSSPPMNYSTANLPHAPPVSHHYVPQLAVVGGPPPLPFPGGGKSTATRTVPYREASVMAEETSEHVGDVLMMQRGGGNGGGRTDTSDNRLLGHNAIDVKIIVDSGATNHAMGDPTLFSSLEDVPTTMHLRMGNGSMVDVTRRGTVRHHNITLHGVLFAPGLAVNIVSVSKLCELGYTVEFTRTSCFIRDAGTGDLVGKGHLVNGLFELDFLEAPRT